MSTSTLVTAEQVHTVLGGSSHDGDVLFDTLVQNIGDAALTVYSVLNRDGEGTPVAFNVEDLYDHYLADVDALWHDTKRVQLVSDGPRFEAERAFHVFVTFSSASSTLSPESLTVGISVSGGETLCYHLYPQV